MYETIRTTSFIEKYPFPVNSSYMIFNLTDFKPDIIEQLHLINCKYNGICMEGFLYYYLKQFKSFNIENIELLQKCFDFIIELYKNKFIDNHSEIPQLETVVNIYSSNLKLISKSLINIVKKKLFDSYSFDELFSNTDSLLFYICLHLLNHLEKNLETLIFNKFKEYFEELIYNINDLKKYIEKISNNFDRCKNIKIGIDIETKKTIENNYIEITGEADLIINDFLIDIKCSLETEDNKDKWHRQLEVYNNSLSMKNIAIINILTNHYIIYTTTDDFQKYDLKYSIKENDVCDYFEKYYV